MYFEALSDAQFFTYLILSSALLKNGNGRNIERRVWMYNRNQQYYLDLMQSNDMHHFFKENFRLKRVTFLKLCEILAPHMMRQSTQLRDAIPLPIRVAIGLRRLGKGDSFESISVEFGVGESTVHGICTELEDILSKMAPVYIKFPVDQDEAKRIIMKFEEKYSIPQIIGAIDGCQFEIKAPRENKECYFNRKQCYSVNMRAIADSSLKFLDISVGFPGSLHDARVFSLSPIYNIAVDRELMNGPSRQINGISVGPLLAVDSAYPLSSMALKQFSTRRRLTGTQARSNKQFCSLRSVIERAFGLLKNRWRLLFKLNEQQLENVVRSITAACVLHNFCILNDDSGEDFMVEDHPNGLNLFVDVATNTADGEDIRNAIMDYMVNEELI